jgi:hypothetical protein
MPNIKDELYILLRDRYCKNEISLEDFLSLMRVLDSLDRKHTPEFQKFNNEVEDED